MEDVLHGSPSPVSGEAIYAPCSKQVRELRDLGNSDEQVKLEISHWLERLCILFIFRFVLNASCVQSYGSLAASLRFGS